MQNKTILAVFMIVVAAVGFVAVSSIVADASAVKQRKACDIAEGDIIATLKNGQIVCLEERLRAHK